MNPDSYNYKAYCNECQQMRSVSCSLADVRSGKSVKVYALACDHSWTLTPEDSKKLREHISTETRVR
jgi:hypothetical protein